MSYARWSDGDVYIYQRTDGMFQCMCCSLMPTHKSSPPWAPDSKLEMHDSFSTESGQKMLAHMHQHREAGDKVPEYAIDRLERELQDGEETN